MDQPENDTEDRWTVGPDNIASYSKKVRFTLNKFSTMMEENKRGNLRFHMGDVGPFIIQLLQTTWDRNLSSFR